VALLETSLIKIYHLRNIYIYIYRERERGENGENAKTQKCGVALRENIIQYVCKHGNCLND
jgi:hypothetical protein